MFGQTALGSKTLSDSANRMFRIEVEGMRQNREADELNYPIRSSSSIYITVPYSRMSEQMQRINRMGGKIVSIEPLTLEGESQPKMEATAAQQDLEAEGKPKTIGKQKQKSDS